MVRATDVTTLAATKVGPYDVDPNDSSTRLTLAATQTFEPTFPNIVAASVSEWTTNGFGGQRSGRPTFIESQKPNETVTA